MTDQPTQQFSGSSGVVWQQTTTPEQQSMTTPLLPNDFPPLSATTTILTTPDATIIDIHDPLTVHGRRHRRPSNHAIARREKSRRKHSYQRLRSNDQTEPEERTGQESPHKSKNVQPNENESKDANEQTNEERHSKHTVKRSSPSDDFHGRYAVDVRGLTQAFGSGKKAKTILHKVDLQIEVGTIYGLLGPSGCGKTTLIRCLLAQLVPTAGKINCFGVEPGSETSGVPGSDVGYMPQEIALYDEFTIYQNLNFYSKLHGMTHQEFEDRQKYLCKLLDLKDTKSKSVKQLSGGQQRRTSLACSLLHAPKLLFLDEPTVGVDPTLRTKIWKYLKKVKATGTSILLTTHYIEEAREADCVGLMRDGKMLKQGQPEDIIKETKCNTLEEAFLKICKADERKAAKEKKKEKNEESGSESEGSDSDSSCDSESDDQKQTDDTGDGSPIMEHDENAKDATARESSHRNWSKTEASPTSPRLTKESSPTFSDFSSKDFTSTKSNQPSMSEARHLQSPTRDTSQEESSFSKSSGKSDNRFDTPKGAPSSDSFQRLKGDEEDYHPQKLTGWTKFLTSLALPRMVQLWALTWKNIQRMIHGVAAMIFQFILPSIQVILFCVAIGKDPMHVHVGLINLDSGQHMPQPTEMSYNLNSAALAVMDPAPPAPNFLAEDLHEFLNDKFVMRDYPDIESAKADVETNAIWGYVYIPYGFTYNMLMRINETIVDPAHMSNETIANSTITYALDLSNEQMNVFLVKSITTAYTNLVTKYAPGIESISPLKMNEPIYGDADASFTDFVAPGIIVVIAFSSSIGLTAITFVLDKKTGNLDRIWSSGVWASEIMLSQVITQLMIFVVQIGLLLIFGLLAFKLPMHGDVILLFIICTLLGITGMMLGLVIASKVTEERDAMQCALGSFFPALLLSGVMWPIEAIPIPLYWVSLGLPTTWAAEAGRSLMSRGWGIEHQQVWLGLVVPCAWSFLLFIWAAKSLRPKK